MALEPGGSSVAGRVVAPDQPSPFQPPEAEEEVLL
jgi:hypothetical protein